MFNSDFISFIFKQYIFLFRHSKNVHTYRVTQKGVQDYIKRVQDYIKKGTGLYKESMRL